jgi:hypothetical protein
MRDAVIVDNRKKPKINLSLLPELEKAWGESTEFLGEKRKWMASSAAVYLWLKLSLQEREALAWRMYDADGKDAERQKLVDEIAAKPKGRIKGSNADLAGHGTETINGVTRPTRRGG